MKVDLTEQQIRNVLAIINQASFSGSAIEEVATIKTQFRAALAENNLLCTIGETAGSHNTDA